MKARISNLHKTETEWLDWEKNTTEQKSIPNAGEFIIYDSDENYPYVRIKVGDGITPLSKLSFIIEDSVKDIIKNIKSESIIDGGRISQKAE